jgi:sigma-E factor negative regulatory protein RseB
MSRRFGKSLVWLLFGFFSITVIAEEVPQAAEQLLVQMNKAARELTYSGTLVYSQGRRMNSMQLYHTVVNGERRERLLYLSGERREIIRRGNNLICASPKRGVYRLADEIPSSPIGRNFAAQLSAAEKTYQLIYRGEGRVAGRQALLVSLVPKDRYRHRFDLALDKNSSLLLRALMLDEKGRVLERIEYTMFSVGDIFDEKHLLPTILPAAQQRLLDDSAVEVRSNPAENNKQVKWQVGLIPESFSMVSHRNMRNRKHSNYDKKQLKRREQRGESIMMYSDGLTAFSVFVASGVNLGEQSRQRGATAAYTVVKEDTQGVYSVTVVGEVPLRAAADIAKSVGRIPAS